MGISSVFRRREPSTRSQTERLTRIRLLRAELDVQADRAVQRTQGIETKSSFVVAGAALLAGVSLPSVTSGSFWYLSLLPIVMAGLTVYFAAKALAPLSLDAPGAALMVAQFVDADMTADSLEDTLLEVRATEIENRDELNRKRAGYMKTSFGLLSWSIFSLVLIAILSGIIANGASPHGQTTPTPGTSETTETP